MLRLVVMACVWASLVLAQASAGPSKSRAMSGELPPFSGFWVLDSKQSVVSTPIPGRSTAVISYDGKTWHYTHRHQSSPDAEPEAWQITLTVDSPTYQVQRTEEITFRTRIQRRGRGLVLEQFGVTHRGQKIHNTTRYTLSSDGNTLTELETSTGPLGPEKNTYVLIRDTEPGGGASTELSLPH
jgi:hypothetical protein